MGTISHLVIKPTLFVNLISAMTIFFLPEFLVCNSVILTQIAENICVVMRYTEANSPANIYGSFLMVASNSAQGQTPHRSRGAYI